jgi:hypothetical protein
MLHGKHSVFWQYADHYQFARFPKLSLKAEGAPLVQTRRSPHPPEHFFGTKQLEGWHWLNERGLSSRDECRLRIRPAIKCLGIALCRCSAGSAWASATTAVRIGSSIATTAARAAPTTMTKQTTPGHRERQQQAGTEHHETLHRSASMLPPWMSWDQADNEN